MKLTFFFITLFGFAFLLIPKPVLSQGKEVVVIPLFGDTVKDENWTIIGADMYNNNTGNVGIGITTPGQKLHIGDGNFLLEGGGETAVQFKRDQVFTNSHVNSPFENPIFMIGRIIEGGDGAPQFRWMYNDDGDTEHVVMELDSEGIMSSVRRNNTRGSHFEGHLSGDTHPLFRLNSYPDMQLQLGPGGSNDTDVAIVRTGSNEIALFTNNNPQLTVDGSGNVGIGETNPTAKLQVTGLAEHQNNADAIANGLTIGAFYRTGDLLKIVH